MGAECWFKWQGGYYHISQKTNAHNFLLNSSFKKLHKSSAITSMIKINKKPESVAPWSLRCGLMSTLGGQSDPEWREDSVQSTHGEKWVSLRERHFLYVIEKEDSSWVVGDHLQNWSNAWEATYTFFYNFYILLWKHSLELCKSKPSSTKLVVMES